MSVSDFDWSGEKILAKRKSDGQHSLEDFAVRATLGEGGFGKVELVKSQVSSELWDDSANSQSMTHLRSVHDPSMDPELK